MANLVLYRKYRPKTFAEIIGQENIVKTLTNAIASGLISHAYLFSGPRGSGKTTMARLLAKAVNCETLNRERERARKKGLQNSQYEPCNQCSSCQEINQGRAVDLIEIDAASHRGIDEIRELKEGIRFVPTKARYKVFIIDEAHQLTKEAANALLKTLEEPPSHAIFILATTEIHKMLPTIISRCQRFDFRPLTLTEIKQRLEKIAALEKVNLEKEAIELIAINSGGSLRDAEGILDQVITFSQGSKEKKISALAVKDFLGLVEIGLVSQFVELLLKKDGPAALSFIQEISEKGSDPQEFVKVLINYLRQGLITKINPQVFNPLSAGLTQEQFQTLKKQIAGAGETQIRQMLETFLEAENKMRYSSLPQLPLELAVVELLQTEEK